MKRLVLEVLEHGNARVSDNRLIVVFGEHVCIGQTACPEDVLQRNTSLRGKGRRAGPTTVGSKLRSVDPGVLEHRLRPFAYGSVGDRFVRSHLPKE